MPELTEKEAEEILKRLDEIEEKIDAIRRDLDVMMQIHELLHPEELEKARSRLRANREGET